MANLLKILSALAVTALMMAAPVQAQDSTATPESGSADAPSTEAPSADAEPASPTTEGLSMGESLADPNAPGTPYDKETHGDWTVRCIRAEQGKDPCELYQLLVGPNDVAAAEISLFALPEGQQAAAGAVIAVPLETLLTQQATLAVDGGQPKRYPFSWCSRGGCFARVGFTAEEIEAFKAGSKASLTIVPLLAPDQRVELVISLSGFTAGYDGVKALNAQ